jgi:hypothetical protein
MKLEMLAAKHGDCLLLHFTKPEGPGLILIDGGPAGVWEGSLRPRLLALRAERGLAETEPLVIDLLIVSHVDDDHINGVLKLLKAMHDARRNHEAPLFRIERLWHNSFDAILGNDETTAALTRGARQFGAAAFDADLEETLREAEAGEARDAALVLASIKQGDDLRRLAGELGIPLNPDFGGQLIQAGVGQGPVVLGDMELVIAGPLHDELVELQAEHDEWLREHPERRADPAAIMAALDDESVANLSSLVLLARSGGKTLLLTGDARGDKVTKGLGLAGALGPDGTLALDILKMPHHGSIRNIDDATLRTLPAQTYCFSGSGKYMNPDRETFELLFATRPGADMTVVLSYRLDELDAKREQEVKKAHQEWNETEMALAPVLAPPPGNVTLVESAGVSVTVTP